MGKRSNVTSLTVHVNTSGKRRARDNAKHLANIAKHEHTRGDCEGFLVVTWNKARGYTCWIQTPNTSPIGLDDVEPFTAQAIRRQIASIDAES